MWLEEIFTKIKLFKGSSIIKYMFKRLKNLCSLRIFL